MLRHDCTRPAEYAPACVWALGSAPCGATDHWTIGRCRLDSRRNWPQGNAQSGMPRGSYATRAPGAWYIAHRSSPGAPATASRGSAALTAVVTAVVLELHLACVATAIQFCAVCVVEVFLAATSHKACRIIVVPCGEQIRCAARRAFMALHWSPLHGWTPGGQRRSEHHTPFTFRNICMVWILAVCVFLPWTSDVRSSGLLSNDALFKRYL